MKVLYAIQGTGNGHMSRALEVLPILQKLPIKLDILVSGTQADLQVPLPIKYRLNGWSFIFGKKGGIDVWQTYLKTNSAQLQKEIRTIPIDNYDLVLNDFEPVSAWACKLHNKACVSLSHQAAVLSAHAPKPTKINPLGRFVLKKYAPSTKQFGLHFKAYEEHMFTPIIREEIRKTICSIGKHYTVYLPAYSNQKIIKTLSQIKGVQWEVFSKHTENIFFWQNIRIRKINNKDFIKSMAHSKGVLCGAGFETPAEALYMGKKLMVIPMKGQFEQHCNAAALKEMGVPVLKSLQPKHLHNLQQWVENDVRVHVDYPDITKHIIDQILQEVAISPV